jgi:hypothetical protein
MKTDKRLCQRFHVNHASVGMNKAGFLGMKMPRETPFKIINLSRSGLQFIANKYHLKNAKLDMAIKCPAFNQSIACRGELRWIKRVPKHPGFFRMGIHFTKMDKVSLDRLSRLESDQFLRTLHPTAKAIG